MELTHEQDQLVALVGRQKFSQERCYPIERLFLRQELRHASRHQNEDWHDGNEHLERDGLRQEKDLLFLKLPEASFGVPQDGAGHAEQYGDQAPHMRR